MSHTPHQIACAVVLAETGGATGRDEMVAGIERVLQELRSMVTPLVGSVGFEAVVRRAAYLSNRSFPWLLGRTLSASPGVVAARLAEIAELHGEDHVKAGVTMLLANVLTLLCRFIGEHMTDRLVRAAWPELTILPDRGTEEA